jgi:hypothetical protein
MDTPYVPHVFGERVTAFLRSRTGWLSAAVVSSIPWPKKDVWIKYAGDDFVLRGTENGTNATAPAITVPCARAEVEQSLSKIYRLTSMLGWFLGGCVDVVDVIQGSHPMGFGPQMRLSYTTVGQAGERSFNCNHLPLTTDDNTRIALAFWREGERLSGVHDSYAFLSYFKVIESQFNKSQDRVAWFEANIDKVSGRAANRVAELRADAIDVNRHLYESGRNAVAHASLGGAIVDPDIPADRKRLAADLILMSELARLFIGEHLKVPTARLLFESRDRLVPWHSLMDPSSLAELRAGGTPSGVLGLEEREVSVCLWPDEPLQSFEKMTLHVDAVHDGAVRVVLLNARQSIVLVFVCDFRQGRIHTQLEHGGYVQDAVDESDVRAYTTYFHRVIGNAIVELRLDGVEPTDCEVVIPVNIIPRNPEEAVEEAVLAYRQRVASVAGTGSA